MNCTPKPVCIPNADHRQQFLTWIERNTEDAAAIDRLKAVLDLVDVDSKGYTARDGVINDAEWGILRTAMNQYTRSYGSNHRFTFTNLASKVAEVRDHQLAIWQAHREFDKGCGCPCP